MGWEEVFGVVAGFLGDLLGGGTHESHHQEQQIIAMQAGFIKDMTDMMQMLLLVLVAVILLQVLR